MFKTCKQCLINQPIDNFRYRKDKDWYLIICKKCESITSSKYGKIRYANPVKRRYQLNFQRAVKKKLKDEIIQYLGGQCLHCGIKDSCTAIYDVHHCDPTKKDFNPAQRMHKSFEVLKPELDKCILLCVNCHRREHVRLTDLKEQTIVV